MGLFGKRKGKEKQLKDRKIPQPPLQGRNDKCYFNDYQRADKVWCLGYYLFYVGSQDI